MRHLYVHVPFCRRRCSYCDFAIAVRRTVPAEAYVDAVLRERDLRRESEEWVEEDLNTLYLGGGTPSLLPTPSLESLITSLAGTLDGAAEVTLEANPDDVTRAGAEAWRRLGITRVSVGAQSFSGEVLAWMHRLHTTEATAAAVGALRAAGIGSVSLDLIFAVPSAGAGVFRADLERALRLEPEHLSVYGLTVEPRTPLDRWVGRGAAQLPDEERYRQEFLLAHELLTREGYEHYEVSNYARPGHRSRHNGVYWLGAPYVGLGPSAHSFDGTVRRWNVRHWAAYRATVADGRDPEEGSERLDSEQRLLEQVYLGLRTVQGIPESVLPSGAGSGVQPCVDAGWLRRDDGRLVPTAEGWLQLDGLATHLTTSPGSG